MYVCRYNTLRDQWTTAPHMHTCRSAAGSAVIDSYIYVVGE